MQSRLQKMNPDNVNNKISQKDLKKVTDTELIHDWIENGESILLRGPSGIGKTQRIRTLYPNAIELKLTNNMFPEKVVGSTNIQTGEEIPPNYAKQIILQSADNKEKADIEKNVQNIYEIADQIYEKSKVTDEKVVVLLDELLNVNPTIQSLVYTLVLNRFVESGEGIKLPKNVVIVATGNQKKYSSAANDLAKPLEKRFDHILDMQPKVGEWLVEFAIPQKLHPAVIGFILYNYEQNNCSEKISDINYFYEEDVDDEHYNDYEISERTNDPRGWETVSRIVENFEKNLKNGKYIGMNVENAFMRSINSKLSDSWTREFFSFYNIPALTPEEIINGYSKDELPQNDIEKDIYAIELLTADETQIEACRKFILKHCSKDALELFDKYWYQAKGQDIPDERQDNMKFQASEFSQFTQEGKNGFLRLGNLFKNTLDKGERDDRK